MKLLARLLYRLRDQLAATVVTQNSGDKYWLWGDSGQVCAFEPPVANFSSLLRNIAINRMGHRVKAISSALHESDGYLPFNYNSWLRGSSTSQLNSEFDDQGHTFRPVSSELKNS